MVRRDTDTEARLSRCGESGFFLVALRASFSSVGNSRRTRPHQVGGLLGGFMGDAGFNRVVQFCATRFMVLFRFPITTRFPLPLLGFCFLLWEAGLFYCFEFFVGGKNLLRYPRHRGCRRGCRFQIKLKGANLTRLTP